MRQESPDILLSVIVPVYNAEKYLYDSLGNLVNQTFLSAFPGGMEILLIDDASTDRSLQILN
ncbi:MAG: glycosyltransferase, partial [Lachnospiraceae bacterium]|nr:glycosyltransferase [Lachnospiraceae bacterium]